MVNLDAVFAIYPDRPTMRIAARNYLRVKERIRHCGQPLAGSWYWIPQKSRQGRLQWDIAEFFDCWASSSEHRAVWKHVADELRCTWRGELDDLNYQSLPRGDVRLVRINDRSRLFIVHGGDCPTGRTGFSAIRKMFCLPRHVAAICNPDQQISQVGFAELNARLKQLTASSSRSAMRQAGRTDLKVYRLRHACD